MNNRRRGLLRAMICVLLAAVCVLVPGGRAAWATGDGIPDSDIRVNYEYETLTVATTKDSVIYFTDAYSDNLDKWYCCEVRNGNASFDISWIKSTATVRLYLCGDVQTKIVSKDIVWRETLNVKFTGTLLTTDITEAEKWKAAYAAYPLFSEDTGYFIFTIRESGRDASYFDLSTIEWRKGTEGTWREFAELDLKELNIHGAALNFRVKAVNDTAGQTGARVSTTAKGSVAKLATPPTVKLTPSGMSINIRNGQEFSFDKVHWILIPEYNKRPTLSGRLAFASDRAAAIEKLTTNERVAAMLITKMMGRSANDPLTRAAVTGYTPGAEYGSLTYDSADPSAATGFYVYVRAAGTSKAAASRIMEILVPFADAAKTPSVSEFVISHGESKTATGGILLENRSADRSYQVAVITPSEQTAGMDWDDLDTYELKWTTVKPGKSYKLAQAKVPEGSYLLYRIAGSDATNELPSVYAVSDRITYDVVTYAGITGSSKTVGGVLTAVVSTNYAIEDVTCLWERCADPDAASPVWTNAGTGSTYTLVEADQGCVLRVTIRARNGSSWVSAVYGPIQ